MTSLTRKHLRLVLAGLFLFVLLAEFGSHVVAHVNSPHSDGRSISAHDGGHDDPCRYLMLCCDNGRSDARMPTSGHQVLPATVLDTLAISLEIEADRDPRVPFDSGAARFRPPNLPFHPPKLS